MNQVIHLTNETFNEQVDNAEFAVIDFTADWCPPCRMMRPIYQQLAQKYTGEISFFAVDGDEFPELMMRYGVRSLPTFMFFHNGHAVKRTVGAMPAAKFEAMIIELLQSKAVLQTS